jgi:hypothetical protein
VFWSLGPHVSLSDLSNSDGNVLMENDLFSRIAGVMKRASKLESGIEALTAGS